MVKSFATVETCRDDSAKRGRRGMIMGKMQKRFWEFPVNVDLERGLGIYRKVGQE